MSNLTKKVLEEYKEQSPVKFQHKFGEPDLEQLNGEVIGWTEPTPQELKSGIKPQPIFQTYTHEEIRALGGQVLVPTESKELPHKKQKGFKMPKFVRKDVKVSKPAPTAPVDTDDDGDQNDVLNSNLTTKPNDEVK